MNVRIPTSIDELKDGLTGLERLLTAKQWERAAIVYAWTHDHDQGQRSCPSCGNTSMSLSVFAKLDITGLRNREQVTAYRKAWESAMEDGAPDVGPGDDVELPNLPWKDHFGEPTKDVQSRVFRQVVSDPEAVNEALKDHPETVVDIAEAVVKTPALRSVVGAKLDDRVLERSPKASRDRSRPTTMSTSSEPLAG